MCQWSCGHRALLCGQGTEYKLKLNVSLEHKSSLKQHRYRQQYIVLVKIIHFSFMPKIIRILRSCSMKIFSKFSTINISKLNFWLVICIAKNLIWTTLKMIFSIFRFLLHPQIPDLQILSDHNKPYINGWLFTQLSDDVWWPLWLFLCSRVTNMPFRMFLYKTD